MNNERTFISFVQELSNKQSSNNNNALGSIFLPFSGSLFIFFIKFFCLLHTLSTNGAEYAS